jgi:hypothetical protein
MTYNSSTLIEVHGTWLRTFAWNWYFTGTFAKPVTSDGARFLLNQYAQSIERITGTALSMYWAVEKGATGNIHIHGLVGNVDTLEAFCGVHLWRYGKAKLSPYRAKGAAPFYVAKSAFPRSKARDLMGNGDWGFIGTPIPLPTKA